VRLIAHGCVAPAVAPGVAACGQVLVGVGGTNEPPVVVLSSPRRACRALAPFSA
jgi:hypothetical protein